VRLTWTDPADLLPHAFVQALSDGVPVDDLVARWVAVGGDPQPPRSGAGPIVSADLSELAGDLLDEIDRRGAGAEQRGLPGVRAVPPLPGHPSDDRVRGAWLGRAIGCVLGKPVEKIPRAGIRAIAEATRNWPITGYFTQVGLPADIAQRWPWNRRSRMTSLVETLDGIPEDDDLNFTMLALVMVERYGDKLATADVAQAWLDNLPAGRVFTAERAVYRNLLLGIEPERAAVVRNPFREWIGALIRADLYGWAHPGDPSAAARLADADASLSHRGDGVYGARWVAGMAAAALVADDVSSVLTSGLAVIPPESRLSEAVRFGIGLAAQGTDGERALDGLHARYGHLHWVHVLNNAALIAYALAASDGELGPAIAIAVSGGWDTDSAGATVGAICGALSGAASLPPSWTDPLGERFRTTLPGFDGVTAGELTARTCAVAS
jgi:ADP-ribosylglycohydrolase